MTRLCVAAVQAGSVLFDTPATLVKGERYIREAAAAGAQLIVLPEAFLGGYPKGLDFGVTVGSRAPEGRTDFARYAASAIVIPGPETTHLAELAAELGVHLVVGAIERVGGTLYCVSVTITPGEGVVMVHRKLMPTAAERYIWGQGYGSTMSAVPSEVGVLGTAICWENYMPLYRQAMYDQGVQVWCAPTVDERDQWQATMRHVALEGRCFVVSACQYLLRSGMPQDVHPVQGEDPDTVLIGGGSVIVSPLGEVLAGPLREREGLVLAQIDLDTIPGAQFDFDPVGHYARPDVFTLHVNTAAQRSVLAEEGRHIPHRP